jgi:hypothetical protein
MANSKISALTSATTPLAGTETLPIVQSSTTKQVSVANLTAGRSIGVSGMTVTSGASTADILITDTGTVNGRVRVRSQSDAMVLISGGGATATLSAAGNVTVESGNLVIGTSGKGIDFSATPGTGTSELLADYEEGTWTPTITPSTSGSVIYTTQDGTYTKVGRQVTIVFIVAGTKSTSSGDYRIGGIPFNISGSAITGAINWYNPLGTPLVNAVAFYFSSTLFRVGVITVASTDATAGSFSSAEVSSTFSLTGTLTYFV